ncbi:hypothetical protein HNY73_010953 [Argiope bruennichi]|uniref:Uncharacterized protein n=1 Tax=Argiope bruennichi TaxID=94029 RepID=A0A8T0F3J1_ARGBR|nr:hypothetical protein HNY73_010953 [Argiope bruennichi]
MKEYVWFKISTFLSLTFLMVNLITIPMRTRRTRNVLKLQGANLTVAIKQEADIGVSGLGISNERSEAVNFTTPYHY